MTTNNDTNSTINLVFGPGLSIDKKLAKSLKKQLKVRIRHLPFDCEYTLEMICGEDYWDGLRRAEKIIAGKYMSYLVTKNRLPLAPVKWRHEYPLKYERK